MTASDLHTPVLLDRTVELLVPALSAPQSVLIDATLGMGGHAEALLNRLPGLQVIGLDRDADALTLAGERLAPFSDRVHLVHTSYDDVARATRVVGASRVQAVLFDLGVSSLQLDRVDRGFSYARDAPLDMRMDRTQTLTAETILAEYDVDRLRRIFVEFGEEKLAARYARAIVRARADRPIRRTGELVALLQAATPAALSRAGHPAKRVFQALRIEVNGELDALAHAIPAALDVLAVSGRIVVLAYQSLEDRLVKRALAARARSTAPERLPIELPEHRPEFRLLTRGAERAGEAEAAENPRSISVRLRAAERLKDAA